MNSVTANAQPQQTLQTVPVSPETPVTPTILVDPYSPAAVILAISVLIRTMKQT
ncbi:MAG TPA: hypothetical protein V6C78_14415 [Crinalium sp.]